MKPSETAISGARSDCEREKHLKEDSGSIERESWKVEERERKRESDCKGTLQPVSAVQDDSSVLPRGTECSELGWVMLGDL